MQLSSHKKNSSSNFTTKGIQIKGCVTYYSGNMGYKLKILYKVYC